MDRMEGMGKGFCFRRELNHPHPYLPPSRGKELIILGDRYGDFDYGRYAAED